MALTDLTRISTSGIATGSTIDAPILRKDVSFRGSQVGVTSALFDSSENELNLKDNVKLTFGNATNGDLRIYHDTSNGSYVREAGPGALRIQGDAGVWIQSSSDNQDRIVTNHNGDVQLFYSGNKKLNTTSHGAVVTGILTATGFSGPLSNASGISTFYDLRVTNNLTVEGTTTTLDTNLIGVDRVNIGANSDTDTAIVGIQSGTADIVNLFDGTTEVLTVKDGGNVGIKTNPGAALEVNSGDSYDVAIFNSFHADGPLIPIQKSGTNIGFIGSGKNLAPATGGASDLALRSQGNLIFTSGGGVEKLRITGIGSVGIGTDDPDYITTIAADGINASLNLKRTSTSVNGEAYGNIFYTTETGQNVVLVRGVRESSNTDGAFTISTKATSGTLDERFRINSGGNLQLGSSADAGNALRYLDIYNLNTGGSAGSILRFITRKSDGSSSVSADIVKYKTGGLYINNNEVLGTTGFISFGTGTGGGSVKDRLRIKDDGDIIIGSEGVWSYPKPLNVQGSSGLILSLSNFDTTTYAANTFAGIELKLKTGNTGTTDATCEIRGLKENGTNGNSARAISFLTGVSAGSNQERLRITSAGLVGIGITNPEAYEANGNNLVVGDTTNHNGITILTGTNKDGRLGFADGTGAASYRGMIEYQHGTGTDEFMKLHVAGDEVVRITSDGKVKIADHGTNDLRSLSVLAPQSQIQWGTAEDVGGFLMSTNNGQFGLSAGGYWSGSSWIAKHTASAQIRTDGDGDISFCSNTSLTSGNSFTPSEKMTIKSTGEVHIEDRNSSNTGEHFFQAGAFGIRMEDTGGYNRWNIERNYGGYKSTPIVHLSTQGRVGINTFAPVSTLDVISTEGLGSVIQKDFQGTTVTTNSSSKLALTIWGKNHYDSAYGSTGTDAYGPMIGFGGRVDGNAPNTGDIRAGISYKYNGGLTFHTEAGGSIADGTNETLRITSKGTTIAYHGAAPSDATTYSSSFRGREGVISPIYYWPRVYGAHDKGGGYTDVAEGGRLTLRMYGATGGTAAMFNGGFGVTYGGGGEAIEYNRVRVIFRTSRANTTDGYNANTITFKMQQYYYIGGWTDISNSSWNFNGTDSERGYRWTASNWISSSDFAGGFDVPSIAIKYDTDNGNLGNSNIRIAAVYLQYARFS